MATEVRQEGESLLARLTRARSVLERERREAPALFEELLALPPVLQLERVNREPRLRTWGLCELLLARAQELADEPQESGRLAGLALTAAQGLDPELHSAPLVQDFKTRAWAAAGEAWRRAGELRRAEEALGAAAGCLAHGTGDLLLDAQLLEFEAAVRQDQGRIGEADALFKQAAARYGALREDDLQARALSQRAELHNSPPEAQLAPQLSPISVAYEPGR